MEHKNGVKALLKKIEQTGDVATRKDSGQPKSVPAEGNKELLEEIYAQLSRSAGNRIQAEIATKFHIDFRLVSWIIDPDLDCCALKKSKVQKFTDSNTEKRKICSRNYIKKTLQSAFISDEKIYEKKILFKSCNGVICV